MLIPLTEMQQTRIVNNIRNVLETKDIENLSKQSYYYISVCSGFIAHYDLYGFRDYYYDTDQLARDIVDNDGWNSDRSNFMKGDKYFEYQHTNGKVYKQLVKIALECLLPMFS